MDWSSRMTLLCEFGQVISPFWASVCKMKGWILVDPRVLFCPGRLWFHESLFCVRTECRKSWAGREADISFPGFLPGSDLTSWELALQIP